MLLFHFLFLSCSFCWEFGQPKRSCANFATAPFYFIFQFQLLDIFPIILNFLKLSMPYYQHNRSISVKVKRLVIFILCKIIFITKYHFCSWICRITKIFIILIIRCNCFTLTMSISQYKTIICISYINVSVTSIIIRCIIPEVIPVRTLTSRIIYIICITFVTKIIKNKIIF